MTLPFAKADPAEVSEAFREYIRGKPCVGAHHPGHECVGRSQFCHVRHRGMGGKNAPSDVGNGFPGCSQLHGAEYHHHWREWIERKYEIDVGQIAAFYGETFVGVDFWAEGDPPRGAYLDGQAVPRRHTEVAQ